MASDKLGLVISNPAEGQFLQRIDWNKEAIMEQVAAIAAEYEGLAYTEEQMKSAKEDRAKLNALRKAISDRRIEVKKLINAPYEKFEAEVKEVDALIAKPIAMIDKQISEYDERVKAEKKNELVLFFRENIGELRSDIMFEQIFDSKWLNSSVSLKKAKEAITQKIESIRADLRSIEAFCEEKYRTPAKSHYLRTLDIRSALEEAKRMSELDRRMEEQRLLEEERKRIEEEEAKKKALPIERGCITGKNPNGTCCCCGNGGTVECCAQCKEDCNGRCGWLDGCKNGESVTETDESVAKTAENVSELPESVSNPDESVTEPTSDIGRAIAGIERQAYDAAVTDPFAPQPEKQYKASFTVYGTKSQIDALKKFLNDNNIKFGKVEK